MNRPCRVTEHVAIFNIFQYLPILSVGFCPPRNERWIHLPVENIPGTCARAIGEESREFLEKLIARNDAAPPLKAGPLSNVAPLSRNGWLARCVSGIGSEETRSATDLLMQSVAVSGCYRQKN